MNFNFKEILELFTGHWRLFALLILVSAMVGGFVIVPLGKSYFESDNHSCGPCLDENKELVGRIIEMSAILREYTELKKAQESMNKSVSEMVVMSAIEEDTISQPIKVIDEANEKIEIKGNKLIERAIEIGKVE